MAYDTKCYDLAASFLEDEPHLNNQANRRELAQLIQTTIEDQICFWDLPKSKRAYPKDKWGAP